MNLAARLTALKEQREGLSLSEQAKLVCKAAKEFEKSGEYEAAYEAVSDFWPDRTHEPVLDGLDDVNKAEVLLRVGSLAGWIGSTEQTPGSHEKAKDFITRSIELFEQLELSDNVAEGRGELALCYWREGSFDEARVNLNVALQNASNENNELRATLLIRAGIIEERTQRLQEALHYYYQAAPLLEESDDHALKGSFHSEFALLFTRLGTEESRRDYLDKALIEATAASFHFRTGRKHALSRAR